MHNATVTPWPSRKKFLFNASTHTWCCHAHSVFVWHQNFVAKTFCCWLQELKKISVWDNWAEPPIKKRSGMLQARLLPTRFRHKLWWFWNRQSRRSSHQRPYLFLCAGPATRRKNHYLKKKRFSFKSRIEWNGIGRGNNIDNGLSPHLVSLFWEGTACSNTGGRLGIPRCSWRPSLNGDCSHGRRNARLTATTSKMEFPYWICGLLMMSLPLHNRVKKSVRDWTCRRMPSHKLILALGNDFATNCLPQSKFWERDGAHDTVYSFLIRSHKDGMHRLDLEHHLVRVPRKVFYASTPHDVTVELLFFVTKHASILKRIGFIIFLTTIYTLRQIVALVNLQASSTKVARELHVYVSQVVHNFGFFVLVRSLKRAAFSAWQPQTSNLSLYLHNIYTGGPWMCIGNGQGQTDLFLSGLEKNCWSAQIAGAGGFGEDLAYGRGVALDVIRAS